MTIYSDKTMLKQDCSNCTYHAINLYSDDQLKYLRTIDLKDIGMVYAYIIFNCNKASLNVINDDWFRILKNEDVEFG